MNKIKQLPLHEAQKIAAGEVVERPANVVKELVENSIDAGAQRITLYIEQGGQSLIRIVDDGCGMSRADAQLCFDHHATSKITSVEDLPSLLSFGFRGEALASISAVSTVCLKTKTKEDSVGTLIQRSASTNNTIEDIACPSGTDIMIQDLFFNVPARKKFLKEEQTEWRHIVHLFHAFCFDYPHIHFSLFSDNKNVYNCPPVATLAERINQVWPDTAKNTMIELSATKKNITISGSISNHTYYRYDRNHLYFFVNKRWIRNQNLSKALLKGYLNVIPPARFPAAVIEVTVDPHEVDINIHPRKQEVQFLHPRMVEQLLTDAVKKALEEHLSAKIKKPVFMQPSVDISSFEQSPFTQNFRTASFDTQPNLVTIPKPQMLKDKEPEPLSEKINNQKILPDQTSGQTMAHEEQHLYKLLGQYHKTYILTESQEGLFIIDQHAAHERILYEQFKERFGSIATIKLLFPQIITLSQADYQRIIEHCSLFEHHGIGIESFGLNQIIIQSTPVHLKNCSLEELIKEISSLIHEYQGLEHEEFSKKVHEKVHAQMACKAAVKAGDELTTEKMEQLLKDLAQTKNRFACPHGRPTGWLLSLDELERTFKRKL